VDQCPAASAEEVMTNHLPSNFSGCMSTKFKVTRRHALTTLAAALGGGLAATILAQTQATPKPAQPSFPKPTLHVYPDYGWLRGLGMVPSWAARIESDGLPRRHPKPRRKHPTRHKPEPLHVQPRVDQNPAPATEEVMTNHLPLFLAGGGFRHGQHLAFKRDDNKPLSNLFVSMLQRMGVDAEAFGSSTGPITDSKNI
jgi:hypothetical protein